MSLVLAYGPQSVSAHPGAAILLEYAPAAAAGQTLRHSARAPWPRATAGRRQMRNPMPPAATLDGGHRVPWGAGSRHASADFCAWPSSSVVDEGAGLPWSINAAHPAEAPRVPWGESIARDTEAAAPWGRYVHRRTIDVLSVWPAASTADIAALAPWARHAARHGHAWVAPAPAAAQADGALRAPWGTFTRRLAPGWGVVTPPNNPPTNEAGTIVTPLLRAYIVVNEISLVRVSNSLALPATALSISADADSWTYQWSATVPASKLDDVLPASAGEPVEFEATINGWPHRLLAEKIALDDRFGKRRVAISGRGLAAKLAAPYLANEARANGQARDASQLCEDALLINATPASGWSIDFNLDDWLVPAGAWVTHGTPMDAINGIAAAAGGYVRPDPTAKVLHLEKRYPVLPWAWGAATPDYELPSAATTKVGIEWIENPPWNAVYVAGSGPGAILGQVKRAGTAGDIVAPMATDPLITAAAAARQRGESILGDAGSGQRLTLEAPVLETVGIYPVGALIRFVDGAVERLGIVRGVSVNASMPKVRQTLEVECHD